MVWYIQGRPAFLWHCRVFLAFLCDSRKYGEIAANINTFRDKTGITHTIPLFLQKSVSSLGKFPCPEKFSLLAVNSGVSLFFQR